MAYRKRVTVTADERIDVASMPFLDAMYAMSPDLLRTDHLKPLHEFAESLGGGASRFLCLTVPPRFGKTSTLVHVVAWLLMKYPRMRVVYCTYAQTLSNQFSQQVRLLCEVAGFQFSPDTNRLERWMSIDGGGLLSTGIQGPLTGFGANLIIVDDPIKGYEDAESQVMRDSTWNWLDWVAFTRLEPWHLDGKLILPSAICVQTRWHPDDISGRLLKGRLARQPSWEKIHLRPILTDDNGEERSLWPEHWPLDVLKTIRADGTERSWLAMYEGAPELAQFSLFGEPVYGNFEDIVSAA